MKDRLHGVIDRFASTRVVVLADLVLDEFLYGEISRVSREAPVLIIQHRRMDAMPGGGANAIRNVRALGGHPLPVGVVGDDETGRRLTALLEQDGIDTAGVSTLDGYETPTKTRVLAGLAHSRPQQVIRVDRGATGTVPAGAAAAAADRAAAALDEGSVGLMLSDYGFDLVTPASAATLLGGRREAGTIITCDSRHRLGEFRGVTAATPNLEEAEEILDARLPGSGPMSREASARLLEKLDCHSILITRGSHGMTLLERDHPPVDIPVYGSDEVADVTGAGDTVIATFTLALAAGASFHDAAILANCAAGLVVMKRGTATVSDSELRHAVDRIEGTAPGDRT